MRARDDRVTDRHHRNFRRDIRTEWSRRCRRRRSGRAIWCRCRLAAHRRDVDVAAIIDSQRVDLVIAGVEQYERLSRRVKSEHAAWRLGAGRARKEDPVSAAAGVVWTAGVGDEVTEGQPLLELHTDDPARIERALEALDGAIGVDTDDEPLPLIIDRITG